MLTNRIPYRVNLVVVIMFCSFLCGRAQASPTDAPYYFHEWKIHHIHDNDYGSAVTVLKSDGYSENDLMAWAPFVLREYCVKPYTQSLPCSVQNDNVIGVKIKNFLSWKSSGLDPTSALMYARQFPLTPKQALEINPIIHRLCKGILSRNAMLANPFDTKGKCYILEGFESIQLLSQHSALFKNWDNNSDALITFTTESAPAVGWPVHVLVRGNGAFSYTTALGTKNIVPSFSEIYKFHSP